MVNLTKFSSESTASFLEEKNVLRFLIIRPGETAYDIQRHIQGNLNLRLTENGQQEANRLAEEMVSENPSLIYTSPNVSALETAECIASSLQIQCKILKGLRNQDQGLWEGRRVAEIQRFQPRVYRRAANSPNSIDPPNGESFREVQKRIQTTIEWLLKRHHCGTIGLVICEPLASLFRCALKSEEAKNLWNFIGRHGLWEPVELPAGQAIPAGQI